MDKLIGTAKKLDAFLTVLFWLLVASIVLIEGIVVITFWGNLSSDFIFAFSYDGIKIPTEGLDIKMLGNLLAYLGATAGVAMAMVCYGLHLIKKILAPMKQGLPFSSVVSINLKKLAWFSLACGIIDIVVSVLSQMYFLPTFVDAGVIETSSYVSSTGDLTFVLVAAFLFLFAYIFEYGETIQQQADETL